MSLAVKLYIAAALILVSFFSGCQVEKWKQSNAKLKSITKQIDVGAKLQDDSVKIVNDKIKKEVEIKYVYRTIKEKINEKNDNRVCFTNESLSLWNDSISGADSNRSESAGTSAENDSVVATVKQVLNNAADNFETCNSNSVKHNALINKVESLKGKMCVCAQ